MMSMIVMLMVGVRHIGASRVWFFVSRSLINILIERLTFHGMLALGCLAIEQPIEGHKDDGDVPSVCV